jgi:hypothetical protein
VTSSARLRRARRGGVAWIRNGALVRGLDYYRHTAFEFVTDRWARRAPFSPAADMTG